MQSNRTLRYWHRHLGVTSALFVVVLVITGIGVNHSFELRLNEHYVSNDWLLDWYNIHTPDDMISFAAGAHWITQASERLYLDGKNLPQSFGPIVGAIAPAGGHEIVIAGADALLLIDPGGALIDHYTPLDGIPKDIRAVGLDHGQQVLLRTAKTVLSIDVTTLEVASVVAADPVWAVPQPLPTQLKASVIAAHRGTGLPLERVLLDIHSGRILGAWGIYLVDAMAVLFLVLSLTGVWLWIRRGR